MGNKSLSDVVFSIIGSISILSVFIVVPYMVGYFTFFDLALLNVFTLAEYYYFSSVPILGVATLFVAYATQPLVVEKMTNFPIWVVRRNPHLKLAMSALTSSVSIHWLFLLACFVQRFRKTCMPAIRAA
jgi:hypothetical protein